MRTAADDYDTLVERARVGGLPSPPRRPVPGECCDRLCNPCVWDYYEAALTLWCRRHDMVRPVQES